MAIYFVYQVIFFLFSRLVNLKVLEVRENRLKTLPKSLCRLVALERLDVGTNEFDVFVSIDFYLRLPAYKHKIILTFFISQNSPKLFVHFPILPSFVSTVTDLSLFLA